MVCRFDIPPLRVFKRMIDALVRQKSHGDLVSFAVRREQKPILSTQANSSTRDHLKSVFLNMDSHLWAYCDPTILENQTLYQYHHFGRVDF